MAPAPPPQLVRGAAMGQEPLLEGPALAPSYHQGYQLPAGLWLQKQFEERCWSLWRSKDAWPRSPVPLHMGRSAAYGGRRAGPSGERPSLTLLPASAKLLKQLLQTSTPQPEALAWAKQLQVQGGCLLADRWWGGIWGFCLGKKNKLPWSSFSLALKWG